MAGFAIRSRFAGHPSCSAKTRNALRLKPDHPIGAGHLNSQINLFQQAFAKLFVDYIGKWQINELSKSAGKPYLSDTEFVEHHQIAPWDFVNNILEESNLPFKINSPSKENPHEPFEPRLTKNGSGIEMSFADLSSGEKVLMSFSLCVYNVTGGNSVFPKLLLLDEVDAPLHPEMVGVMLRVLKNVLVEKHNINVMLTTHKPTTVALAPSESIYIAVPGEGLNKIDVNRAIALLTVGVPTLAFTTDLRLQVFTEAEADANFFSAAYQLYKGDLTSNRSLQFIPSGRRTSSGDLDSGCERVIDLVQKLRSNGAGTVLGLVDWDGKPNVQPWVVQHSEGRRHSLENLVLDPVILIIILARDYTPYARSLGLLLHEEAYASLLSWTGNRWQEAIDHLSEIIFPGEHLAVQVAYRNGMSLNVTKKFLIMRGHDLRCLVNEKLNGALDKYQGDKLPNHLSTTILPDIKNIMPNDIFETLENLLLLGEHM